MTARRGHPLLRGVLSGRGEPAQRMVGSLRLRAELTARLCQLAQLRRQGLLTAAESGAAMARLLGLDRARRKAP